MKRKKLHITKLSILLITIVTFLIVTAISVGASYLKNSGEVKNFFSPADSVTPKIVEKFKESDNTVKEDVYFEVGDTGYPVYVRAAIVITWQDKDGIVYFSKPTSNTDYEIDLNLTDWELRDGLYYYKKSVVSGGETSILINKCEQIKAAPVDGYTLSVEVIVQTVQAIGYTDGENGTPEKEAWKDAWNIS